MNRVPPSSPESFPEPSESVKTAAMLWVVRHDRGLNAGETAEFHRWLAEDSLHAIAWEEQSNLLHHLDRLTISRAISPRVRHTSHWWRWAPVFASAAVVILALTLRTGDKPVVVPTVEPAVPATASVPSPVAKPESSAPTGNPGVAAAPAATAFSLTLPPSRPSAGANMAALRSEGGQVRRLSDGTVVYLKAGAEFYEMFNATYRAVNLVRGEAMFDVAPTDERLFVLTAGVRRTSGAVAVATTDGWFDVSVLDGSVETKVITGRAKVSAAELIVAAGRAGSDYNGTITEAGLIARIEYPSRLDSDIHVLPLAQTEITELMAWKRSVESSALPVNLGGK